MDLEAAMTGRSTEAEQPKRDPCRVVGASCPADELGKCSTLKTRDPVAQVCTVM